MFESYLFRLLAEEKLLLDSSTKKVYGGLKCPELLLWIAEASGVDSSKVEEASKFAKEIIDTGTDGRTRNKAGAEMKKEIISWEVIEKSLKITNSLLFFLFMMKSSF